MKIYYYERKLWRLGELDREFERPLTIELDSAREWPVWVDFYRSA